MEDEVLIPGDIIGSTGLLGTAVLLMDQCKYNLFAAVLTVLQARPNPRVPVSFTPCTTYDPRSTHYASHLSVTSQSELSTVLL